MGPRLSHRRRHFSSLTTALFSNDFFGKAFCGLCSYEFIGALTIADHFRMANVLSKKVQLPATRESLFKMAVGHGVMEHQLLGMSYWYLNGAVRWSSNTVASTRRCPCACCAVFVDAQVVSFVGLVTFL